MVAAYPTRRRTANQRRKASLSTTKITTLTRNQVFDETLMGLVTGIPENRVGPDKGEVQVAGSGVLSRFVTRLSGAVRLGESDAPRTNQMMSGTY